MGDIAGIWLRRRYGIDMDSIREPLLQKYFPVMADQGVKSRPISRRHDTAVAKLISGPGNPGNTIPHRWQRYRQRCWIGLCLLCSLCFTTAAHGWTAPPDQPSLSPQTVDALLTRVTAEQAMLWQELHFPLTMARDDGSQQAQLLQVLLDEGVVTRRAAVEQRKREGGGSRIEAIWHYRLSQTADWRLLPHGRELVYGRPAIKQVISVSPAYWVDDAWYAEVIVEWYVADLAEWAKHPRFRQLRLFRRSYESFDKPFTRAVNLQFTEQGWVVWRGMPG